LNEDAQEKLMYLTAESLKEIPFPLGKK
jgi:hypothetical protein